MGVLVGLLAGCGSDGATAGGSTGDPPPPAELACALDLATEIPDALSEGGRLALGVTAGDNVIDLQVATTEGVAWATFADGELVARAAYGAASARVTLVGTCGSDTPSLVIDVPLRPLAWEALPTWTAGVDGPLEREYGSMWIDPASPDKLFVFGGYHYEPQQFTPANDLWSYDLTGRTWTAVAAPDAPFLPGAGLAPTDAPGVFLLYGGVFSDGQTAPTTPPEVWRVDAEGSAPFVAEEVTGFPMGDYQPSFIYDAPRGRYIAACGLNTLWGLHCRIRSLDPATGTWVEIKAALDGAPTGRNGHFFVHDEATERLVIFGGDQGGTAACDCASDTWALELAEDPPRWTPLAAGAPGPIGRRNGAYALDPEGHRMFVWGGTPDGMTTASGLWALDLDRGHEAWSSVEIAEHPPERSSGRAVYDAPRRRILAGFGNSTEGVYADLWALNL